MNVSREPSGPFVPPPPLPPPRRRAPPRDGPNPDPTPSGSHTREGIHLFCVLFPLPLFPPLRPRTRAGGRTTISGNQYSTGRLFASTPFQAAAAIAATTSAL